MKKITYLAFLFVVVFLIGCGSKHEEEEKIDITDTEFNVETCDKYFELMNCILENDSYEVYTEEMRNELRKLIKDMQTEWEWLDQEELHEKCNAELEKYGEIKDRLEEIWCSGWLSK